jgi:hypothetical protein
MTECDATIETTEVVEQEAPMARGSKTAKQDQMSLSECGQFDMKNHARENLTAWGAICKERCENRKSKRGEARRARK